MAEFDEARITALLADPGIVRNRAKVAAAISNARATLAVQGWWLAHGGERTPHQLTQWSPPPPRRQSG